MKIYTIKTGLLYNKISLYEYIKGKEKILNKLNNDKFYGYIGFENKILSHVIKDFKIEEDRFTCQIMFTKKGKHLEKFLNYEILERMFILMPMIKGKKDKDENISDIEFISFNFIAEKEFYKNDLI